MNTKRPAGLILLTCAVASSTFIVYLLLRLPEDWTPYEDLIPLLVEEPEPIVDSDMSRCLHILNQTGNQRWEDLSHLLSRLEAQQFDDPTEATLIKNRMLSEMERINNGIHDKKERDHNHYNDKPRLTFATIICGASMKRRLEAQTMLKSLLLFSQDAALHLVIFSDVDAIVNVALDVLKIRWTMQEKFGIDFTFEIHLDQFPEDGGIKWKSMYRLCATQRLFFPDLLPHIDSLIYIDTDMVVLSNVTQLWQHFQTRMIGRQLAAMAMNNEDSAEGWYGPHLGIPFYGKRGLNAGLMLMNLTRMRKFGFSKRAVATQQLYKERIQLADQDIVNIMFAAYPEYVSVLSCSYNFNWIHCGGPKYNCENSRGENVCFCKAALDEGIKIIHGNSNTFYSTYKEHTFLVALYKAFKKFDLLKDNPWTFFGQLKTQFDQFERKPCQPLTSDILYWSALDYLHKIGVEGSYFVDRSDFS